MTPQPHALDLPYDEAALPEDLRAYFARCRDKLGFVPNVLASYAFDANKLRVFIDFYNDLMLGASPLGKLEREMIAVVVSAANRCFYCLTAHGAAVRQLSGSPLLGEQLVMNYRVAALSAKDRAMLDFAHKLTVSAETVGESDRAALRSAGFDDRAIWDIAAVAAFYNMTNRLASAVEMQPNLDYHAQARG